MEGVAPHTHIKLLNAIVDFIRLHWDEFLEFYWGRRLAWKTVGLGVL